MDDDDINARHCNVCNLDHDDDDPVHNNSPLHRFNFLLFEWSKYRKALVKNRHGIEVTITLNRRYEIVYNTFVDNKKGKLFVKVTPQVLHLHGNVLEFPCTVKNTRRDSIILTSAKLLHCFPMFSLIDPNNNLENDKIFELKSGADYTVIVKFSSGQNGVIGGFKIPLSLSFQTLDEVADNFTIARSIIISVGEETTVEEDSEPSPFQGKEWPPRIQVYPPTKNQIFSNKYPIPKDIAKFLRFGLQECPHMHEGDHQILYDLRRSMLPGHVTLNNYKQFWHIVLWLEEMGQTLGLQRYNMQNVRLTRNGSKLLELTVPGLAEKRPSVIVGDMIDLKVHGDHIAYRGYIKRVNDKSVEISDLDTEFIDVIKNSPQIEVDVRFLLGRLPLERKHQAVNSIVANGTVKTLFSSVSLRNRVVPQLRTLRDSEFYNQTIVKNPEQKTAVQNILNASSSPAPYIVFGPPGTGKTVTIVEAILQIKNRTQSKILVCAAANAACDMLTQKLMMYCKKDELIRIMSETVDTTNMNEFVLDYSNYKDGVFSKVDPAELKKYRIVITTLILIGRYSGRYKPDVVFVDEAAQACEPEVACALAMLDKGGHMVLAGDPRQLGPSFSSNVARRYGFGISLLERLMELELYKSGDTNYITMLKQNFRSHSTILRLPNKLFYGNCLVAAAPKSENDPIARVFVYEKIKGLNQGRQGKNIKRRGGEAVEFCNIISKESREGRSPSYYNEMELQMVLKYVKALIALQFDDVDDKILPEQIGVVTPYVRQVYKLRQYLKNNLLEDVEVGTTETFQGREKRIIIVSTVRAQQDLLLHDKKYNLGFVRNEKRFNVALTRAMSKLIVIGCAHVLGTDRKWSSYIELCENLNGFCGAPYIRRTQDVIQDITNRFNNIRMQDSQFNK